jgi:hypothetical protein
MVKRQTLAFLVVVLIAVGAAVAVLLSETHVNSRQAAAEAYCSKEPGMPSLNGPEFQTCIDQYLMLR